MKDMDKYVEEKAKELFGDWLQNTPPTEKVYMPILRSFIRTIVEDCQVKVGRAFVEKYHRGMTETYPKNEHPFDIKRLFKMLDEAGVKVED